MLSFAKEIEKDSFHISEKGITEAASSFNFLEEDGDVDIE